MTGNVRTKHEQTVQTAFELWRESITNRTVPEQIHLGAAGGALNTLGLTRRELLLLGGHPGSGKTALAQQLMFDALRQPAQTHLTALVCNVEMPVEALFDRELARVSGVPYGQIRQRTFPYDATDRLDVCMAQLDEVTTRITFLGPPFSAERLVNAAWETGADIVVVDYLQRLRAHGIESRVQVAAAMEAVREIADGGAAVIAVAALNRNSYETAAQSSGSFRDSSEIEYGADSAYIIQRDPKSQNAKLKCVKRRYGSPTDLKLQFDGDRQMFTSREQDGPN